jgi:hypothetical protein
MLDRGSSAAPAAALQSLPDWAAVYVRYLQIFRKLEMSYDQMVHPQKRLDMKRALEACMGRMLELRHWMVRRSLSCSRSRQACSCQLRRADAHRTRSHTLRWQLRRVRDPPPGRGEQVKLNRGLDIIQLDDLLMDLKLTPDVLEVPVPRYFVEDRAAVSDTSSMAAGPCQPGPSRQEEGPSAAARAAASVLRRTGVRPRPRQRV